MSRGTWKRRAIATLQVALRGLAVSGLLVVSTVHADEPPAGPGPQQTGAPSSPDPGPPDPPSSRRGPIRTLGDIGQFANPAAAALVALSEDDSDGLRDLARGCLITVVGTSLLKQVFNFTPLGERPSGGPNSFPSGHAAAAMCAPAFLHERYRETRYTAPLTASGAFVAYSRIWARKHRLRDVLASTALAVVVAHNTTERRDDDDHHHTVSGGSGALQIGATAASAAPGGIQIALVESAGVPRRAGSPPARVTGLIELGSWSRSDGRAQGYWGLRIAGSF